MALRPKQFKTLAISFTPDPQAQGGVITIDIGKYYDNSNVRVVKAWAYSLYTDNTAGASAQEGDSYMFLIDTTIMEVPDADIVPNNGVAVNSGNPMIPGDRNGEFNFLGDAVLQSPVFQVQITGVKRAPGAYPALFQFVFYIVVQLEFDFANLDEEWLKFLNK